MFAHVSFYQFAMFVFCFLYRESLSWVEASRVALPHLASSRVELSRVVSCRCASQLQNRFYSYQISNKMQQCWSPTSLTPHTPTMPASVILLASVSLSLTCSLNRAQKSTTIQNKRRRRQSRTRAAQQQQQFWTKMPTTTTATKSARLSNSQHPLSARRSLALFSLCLCSLTRSQTGFRCGWRCACVWIIIKTAKAKNQQQLQQQKATRNEIEIVAKETEKRAAAAAAAAVDAAAEGSAAHSGRGTMAEVD